MSEIDYHFVGLDNPFMQEAVRAREECAGDSIWPIGAVLVREGQVVARAGNGFNQKSDRRHICQRIVNECPSGTGYELCHLHDAEGHAEQMLIKVAREHGIETIGADVYLYGHWWCCEPCWKAMIDAGVCYVYLLENAEVEFSRDRVYAQTLRCNIKSVFVVSSQFEDKIKQACSELGCKQVDSVSECDVLIQQDSSETISIFQNGVMVYKIENINADQLCRMLKNVLRQL